KLIQDSKEKGYILAVKLVRGAYLEKESRRAEEKGYKDPMQPSKEATDRDYDAALALCIENIDHVAVCAGTHNDASSLHLTELMRQKGLEPQNTRIWFAQLLGMSDNISFNLAHAGYNVAKYLPYGPVKAVMPYLMRRAEENTSIAGQSSREVRLLAEEVKRRKV
ncbi:MAG: proline dehydrogenase family protein, partial [Bacteroidota bacterium]